jgi:formamidopyrimidine-DNA glycosylase
MPEGPEVIITTQYLSSKLKGKFISGMKVISGRYYSNINNSKKKVLNGKEYCLKSKLEIIDIKSKGKFIYFTLKNTNGEFIYLLNTLGLSGQWSFYNDKQTRVIFNISDGDKSYKLYFIDMRNFGTIEFTKDINKLNDKLNSLAPDILRSNISTDELYDLMISIKRDSNLVKLLMDQKKLVSGIGNYLVAEILYNSKIDPNRSLFDLSKNEKLNLAYSMRYVSKLAYYDNTTGYMKLFDGFLKNHKKKIKTNIFENFHKDIIIDKPFNFNVYRQKKDPLDNDVKKKSIIKGRHIYYVPEIQK